jgi:hypothetical protein
VIQATVHDVTALALAVKEIEVRPVGMLADEGNVRLALSSDRATVTGAGADRDRVTKHVVLPGVTMAGAQLSQCDIGRSAVSVSSALDETPFRVATICTVLLAVTAPAVAVKVLEVTPAGTVMDPGKVRLELLSDNDKVNPAEGAA